MFSSKHKRPKVKTDKLERAMTKWRNYDCLMNGFCGWTYTNNKIADYKDQAYEPLEPVSMILRSSILRL